MPKFHALTPTTIIIYVLFLIEFLGNEMKKLKKKKERKKEKGSNLLF